MILQIELNEDEMQSLKHKATIQGFDKLEDYAKALLTEPTKEDILEDIRQGIMAIRRGDKMPTIDDLWAELEREDNDVAATPATLKHLAEYPRWNESSNSIKF